jgi:hypothetical protein
VLANSDAAAFRYIIKWTAWTLQNPDNRAEVALIFKGGRGTGKGAFARAVKQAFGQHGMHISSDKHLTGHFNAHFQDCALLFADEAFWPGHKAAEGSIKRLITEPTLLIEPKGVNAYEVENCIHLIMATNEKWVVPAGEDERRYAVFKVCELYKQSKDYFRALFAEMEAGGSAAMMHDLLAYDLKGWHPRDGVPQTDALHEQKLLSLSPERQWWFNFIKLGELPPNSDVERLLAIGSDLYDHMRKTVPALKVKSDHFLSDTLKEGGCDRDHDYRIGKSRAWQFPPLAEARKKWDKEMGGATKWVGEEWVKAVEWF